MVEEGVILKHQPDAAAMWGHRCQVAAVQQDTAAIGSLEARDHTKERALPGSARPEDGDDLAVGELERRPVERRLLLEANRDVFHAEHQNQPAPRRWMRSTSRIEVAATTMRITASA